VGLKDLGTVSSGLWLACEGLKRTCLPLRFFFEI